MDKNIEPGIRIALGVSSFLPYTMSWIYRQLTDPRNETRLVITRQIENANIFPFSEIILLPNEPYYVQALKAKLWFWFGNRPINFQNSVKKKIRKQLVEKSIQVMHVHFGTFGIYMLENCEELNVPLLVTFHGFDISSAFNRWPAYKKLFPDFLNRIKYALVISQEMKDRMIGIGCPAEKIRVSYLGVPTDEFPYHDREHHTGPVKFLHAGRLTAKKGVPDLVRAFKDAFPVEGVAELWIAGDGEERGNVLEAVKQSGAGSYIKILGRQSNEDLLSLRNDADVFVLNCRTDHSGTKEGLPIATLEAASTGLPAISTYHAGIPESINHGQTGIMVNEFDQEALTGALTKMMDTRERRHMGYNARKFMEEKFDLKICNQLLLSIYREALVS